jgi:hypothetical protein
MVSACSSSSTFSWLSSSSEVIAMCGCEVYVMINDFEDMLDKLITDVNSQ